jgi:hypothetical protein
LFNPNLKERGPDKLVYATPLAFRIVFFVIALVIFFSVVSASEGPFFSRFNGISAFIILTCIAAALYLERWIFDKQANMFERNVGLYFLFSRKKIPLDRLEKVILREIGMKRSNQQTDKIGLLSRVTRRTAMLSIEDKDGDLYKLDIVKGGTVREARVYAQKLSDFCEIPLEDDLGDLSGKTHI